MSRSELSRTVRIAAVVTAALAGVSLLAGCGGAADPGDRTAVAPFALLATAPQGYQGVGGSATLSRHDDGTSVAVALTGLLPDTDFVAHVHSGQCTAGGGPHFRIDPDGSDMPPNEIHLRLRSDAAGTARATAENATNVGPEARAVVVHPADLMDNRVACAQLS